MDATLPRRSLLIGAGALALSPLALAACNRVETLTASITPPLDMKLLNREVRAIARRVRPGRLGVGLTNLESGEYFTFNGDSPLPLQSVFKLHLAAAYLAEADAGRATLDEAFDLTELQLSPPWSPISAAWPGRRTYTALELITAAVQNSDNTAADVLMKRIGGPGALTAWLRQEGFEETRVDRYERELQIEAHGMPSFRPEWARPEAFDAARNAVPADTRLTALNAYLRDPRDRASARSMLAFLSRLNVGELLTPASTQRLMQILHGTQTGRDRLSAGLPKGARFAHKTGTSGVDLGINLAVNDAGIAVLPDGRSYAMTAFLAGSRLETAAADAVLADLARVLVRGVG